MLLGVFEDKPVYRKFLILVSIVLFSTLVFSMFGALLADALYGVDMINDPNALSDFSDPAVLAAMKLIQVLTSGIGMFIIPALIAAVVFSTKPGEFLGLVKRPGAEAAGLTILLMFAAVPLINALLVLNQGMQLPSFMSGIEAWIKEQEENAALVTEAFLNMKSTTDLLQNLFIIAVIPAIGEELLFRGVIQRLFTDLTQKPVAAIVLSAILFSALHMQFYGFVPRMALGIMFGFLYLWSGSLWLPILAHLVNNAAAVWFAYLNKDHGLPFDEDTVGTLPGELPYLIGSVLIVALILYRFYKKQQEQPQPES
jgi:membrane protease YdiL (CAAX protease family)